MFILYVEFVLRIKPEKLINEFKLCFHSKEKVLKLVEKEIYHVPFQK